MKFLNIFLLLFFTILYSSTAEDFINNLSDPDLVEYYQQSYEAIYSKTYELQELTKEILDNFFWLTDEEKGIILSQKKQVKTLSQLNLTKETRDSLKPIIRIKKISTLHIQFQERLNLSLEHAETKQPLDHLQRVKISYRHWEIGAVTQKDPLEEDFVDHAAGYLTLNNWAIINKMVAGFFKIKIGSGLLISGNSMGGNDPAFFRRDSFTKSKISPYRSSSEYGYLCGVASDLKYHNFSLLSFYSKVSRDVSVSDSGITSFDESGIHLDTKERDSVGEIIYGLSFQYSKPKFSLGLNYINQSYNKSFSDPIFPTSVDGVSFDFTTSFESIDFKGEFGYNCNQINCIVGCLYEGSGFKQLLVFRRFEKNNPFRYSSSISAGSNPENEIGIYHSIGIKIEKFRIDFSTNLYRYPETKFWEKMPTSGIISILNISKKFDRFLLNLKLQRKGREEYVKIDNSKIRDTENLLLKINLTQSYDFLKLSTSWRYQQESFPAESIQKTGNLSQIRISCNWKRLQVYSGIAVSYGDLLMYFYENNLTDSFANSTISGDGIISYLMLKIRILNSLKCELRIRNNWAKEELTKLGFQIIWKI